MEASAALIVRELKKKKGGGEGVTFRHNGSEPAINIRMKRTERGAGEAEKQ